MICRGNETEGARCAGAAERVPTTVQELRSGAIGFAQAAERLPSKRSPHA
jgi:hypothetical protein